MENQFYKDKKIRKFESKVNPIKLIRLFLNEHAFGSASLLYFLAISSYLILDLLRMNALGFILFIFFISFGSIPMVYYALHKFVDFLNNKYYGRSMLAYWLLMLSFIFIFAFVYSNVYFLEGECLTSANGSLEEINSFWNIFYFSGVTLSSLGYGDFYPNSFFCKNISLFEVFLGLSINVVFIAIALKRIDNTLQEDNKAKKYK